MSSSRDQDSDFLEYFEKKRYYIATGIFCTQCLILLQFRRSHNISTLAMLVAILPMHDTSHSLSNWFIRYDLKKHIPDLDSKSPLRQAITPPKHKKDIPIIVNGSLTTHLNLTEQEKTAYMDHVERLVAKQYTITGISIFLSSLFALHRKYTPLSSLLIIGSSAYVGWSRSGSFRKFQEISRFMRELPDDSLLKQLILGNEEAVKQILHNRRK